MSAAKQRSFDQFDPLFIIFHTNWEKYNLPNGRPRTTSREIGNYSDLKIWSFPYRIVNEIWNFLVRKNSSEHRHTFTYETNEIWDVIACQLWHWQPANNQFHVELIHWSIGLPIASSARANLTAVGASESQRAVKQIVRLTGLLADKNTRI